MTTSWTSLKTTLSGYLKYRGREGQTAFMLRRITGLGTLLFLTIHIVDTAAAYYYPPLYEHAIVLYRLPLFMVGEIFLVFSVVYHGVNGFRIAYLDLIKPKDWMILKQRKSAKTTLIISTIIWLPAAWIMASNMIKHLGE